MYIIMKYQFILHEKNLVRVTKNQPSLPMFQAPLTLKVAPELSLVVEFHVALVCFDIVEQNVRKSTRNHYANKKPAVDPAKTIAAPYSQGGGGTGKSHLIRAIYHTALKTFKHGPSNPEMPTLLMMAPTGVAAVNIDATTINTGLAIPKDVGDNLRPLSDQKRTQLRISVTELKAHYAPSKPRNSRDSDDDYSDDYLKDCSYSSQSSIHSACSSDESSWMDEAIETEKKHDTQSEDSSDDEEKNVLKEHSSVEQEKQHQEDQMVINDNTIPSTDNNYFYSSLNNWICHILIKFKLKYNCSNGLLIAIINFTFLYN
ncbi:uncharacterized protein LOC114962530 isoform X2 [Acropora millepora]|uniref:uncharacterized protein LOC114962530 isoform X2 n=1 Tax=Acropora millepora TaxID=45264 RepID=UPI001CF321D4|nr:uncharacterized protein LOC114962530 isoform X2 [Acropora millepora]